MASEYVRWAPDWPFEVRDPRGNGDCLYLSIARILHSPIYGVARDQSPYWTVEKLRNVVADGITPGLLEDLRIVAASNVDGVDEWAYARDGSLGELRARIRRPGQEVGGARCVWGDEVTLGRIGSYFNLVFVVLLPICDGQGRFWGVRVRWIIPEHDDDPRYVRRYGILWRATPNHWCMAYNKNTQSGRFAANELYEPLRRAKHPAELELE